MAGIKSKTTPAKDKKPKQGRIKAIKKEVDGIMFDSTMEANYYIYLKEEKKKGHVLDFELQPEYPLLDSYKKYGRTIRGMKYISDFLVTYADGSQIVIDVKGKETDDFKIKRKLFDYKYPDLTLKLVTWVEKTKQWVDYDELKKTRSRIKREKNKLKKQQL